MMKEVKVLATLLHAMVTIFILLCFSVVFTACENNDNDNDNNNTGGGMSSTDKRIKSITYHAVPDDEVTSFAYDEQGRIATCETYYSEIYTYTYEEDAITVVHDYTDTSVYTLTNGLVTNRTSDNYTEHYRYKNNNLIGYTEMNHYYGSSNESSFSWSNGNLTQIDDDGDIYSFNYNTDISHDRIELLILFYYYMGEYFDPGLILQGYFGNGTKNRFSQLVEHYDDDDSSYDYVEYTYNSDGDIESVDFGYYLLTFEWESSNWAQENDTGLQ